jgi:hypothetical protein
MFWIAQQPMSVPSLVGIPPNLRRVGWIALLDTVIEHDAVVVVNDERSTNSDPTCQILCAAPACALLPRRPEGEALTCKFSTVFWRRKRYSLTQQLFWGRARGRLQVTYLTSFRHSDALMLPPKEHVVITERLVWEWVGQCDDHHAGRLIIGVDRCGRGARCARRRALGRPRVRGT